ncbi:MAG: hypothetical protein CBC25_06385 [Pelagibacteraceae bacterium TMED65]|nr:hypothetical protein [Rickettsiales bacterium]OUU51047.1 MAG: hypothetical protein CBC25_06385 [Pelagibacteraceae bacterium TMED65]|tara:strand:+ start:6176 stop:6433 length:258 start_codon:yes stop_codon:yes gene_type:complete
MKFFSFFIIFSTVTLTISVKLMIANQEKKISNINQKILKIDSIIEKLETDISYATRPQELESLNRDQFDFIPILQSDIKKLEENK